MTSASKGFLLSQLYYDFILSIFYVATANLVTMLIVFEVSWAHTVKHKHKPGRNSLDEWSAHSTQQIRQTNNYTFTGIRNRNPSKQMAL